MIWQILSGLDSSTRNNLYRDKNICGCIYQSFSDFEANIFFRFLFNGLNLQRKDISSLLEEEGKERLAKTLQRFAKFNICENIHGGKMNQVFAEGVDKYIKNPQIDWQQAPSSLMDEEKSQNKQSFSLLGLLFKDDTKDFNEILESCRLQKIHHYDNDALSLKNFNFISSDVANKIGILVKGFLDYKNSQETIKAVIQLNFLDPQKLYKVKPDKKQIINQLAQLRLIKKEFNNQYFRISNAFHHFAFDYKKQFDVNQDFKCEINIETNFKVYAKVTTENEADFHNFKGIMRKLIELQYEDFNIQELIIGKITEEKTKKLFRNGIRSNSFFNFFKQYIDSNTALEKDLGKWKKLKFLGLQGPADESVIPNNVKQQVRLWESIFLEQDL